MFRARDKHISMGGLGATYAWRARRVLTRHSLVIVAEGRKILLSESPTPANHLAIDSSRTRKRGGQREREKALAGPHCSHVLDGAYRDGQFRCFAREQIRNTGSMPRDDGISRDPMRAPSDRGATRSRCAHLRNHCISPPPLSPLVYHVREKKKNEI